MTREDIKKILGEGATEEQISNTLNALHNQTNALNKQISELKANESKYSDYNELKSQLDAINKEKMTEQERIANINAQINNLKEQLASTDYKIIKCTECSMVGEEMPYDVNELHAERQAIRDEINLLEYTL